MAVNVGGALNAPVRFDGIWSLEEVDPVGSDGTSVGDSVILADGRAPYSMVPCQ